MSASVISVWVCESTIFYDQMVWDSMKVGDELW